MYYKLWFKSLVEGQKAQDVLASPKHKRLDEVAACCTNPDS